MPRALVVPSTPGPVTALVYERVGEPARASLVLAHGAGAGQRHPFLVSFAESLAALGLDVITFNFPYMELRRKLPDRAPVLEGCYQRTIEIVRREVPSSASALFIGGKSMGGRMATHVAAADPALPLAGLVLLGYPLHPPGQPERRRDAHLPGVGRPALFVQGSRDTFGTPDELRPALNTMTPPPALHVVDGGDHSFKIKGADKAEQVAREARLHRVIAAWILALTG
jgi:predicted alpha/beta-hydrolase family hydrolase